MDNEITPLLKRWFWNNIGCIILDPDFGMGGQSLLYKEHGVTGPYIMCSLGLMYVLVDCKVRVFWSFGIIDILSDQFLYGIFLGLYESIGAPIIHKFLIKYYWSDIGKLALHLYHLNNYPLTKDSTRIWQVPEPF